MKVIKAIVYVLAMSLSLTGVAEAKSKSGSFRGGFSSQKPRAPAPQKTYSVPKPREAPKQQTYSPTATPGKFGAFGNKTAPVAATPPSVMSKDLDTSAAKANALKTADARDNAPLQTRASTWGAGNSGSHPPPVSGRNPSGATGSHSAGLPGGSSAPVVVRENHGLMYGLLGFMLGQSIAQNSHATTYQPARHEGSSAVDSTEQELGQSPEAIPPQVEKESFFWSLLRILLWAAVIAIGIFVFKFVRNLRKRKLQTHYTLN